eukprot:7379513-Prymnesium_polylepis.1
MPDAKDGWMDAAEVCQPLWLCPAGADGLPRPARDRVRCTCAALPGSMVDMSSTLREMTTLRTLHPATCHAAKACVRARRRKRVTTRSHDHAM